MPEETPPKSSESAIDQEIVFGHSFSSVLLIMALLSAANAADHLMQGARAHAALWTVAALLSAYSYHMYIFNGYATLSKTHISFRKSLWQRPRIAYTDIRAYSVESKYLILRVSDNVTHKIALSLIFKKQR